MPRKPKRPCSYPGCPELTDRRFCEEHAKKEAARYEKYDRDPATRKRYGRAWKRIRDRYIAAHPLCEECKRQGKLTPATEVSTFFLLQEVEPMIEAILCPFVLPVTLPSLQKMETVGEPGRGSQISTAF